MANCGALDPETLGYVLLSGLLHRVRPVAECRHGRAVGAALRSGSGVPGAPLRGSGASMIGVCRSGRTSCTAGSDAVGVRGRDAGRQEVLGGKSRPRSAAKKAYAAMQSTPSMVEAPPPAPFVVIQSQLVFQLLVVALDPPADPAPPHEIVERHMLGDVREPVLRRFTLRPSATATKSHSGSRAVPPASTSR